MSHTGDVSLPMIIPQGEAQPLMGAQRRPGQSLPAYSPHHEMRAGAQSVNVSGSMPTRRRQQTFAERIIGVPESNLYIGGGGDAEISMVGQEIKQRTEVEIQRRKAMSKMLSVPIEQVPDAPAIKGEDEAKAKATKSVVNITVHRFDLEKLAAYLRTNLSDGLTLADHTARLAAEGPNVLTPAPVTPWWKAALPHFIGGFQKMMIFAGVLCIVLYAFIDHTDSTNLVLGIIFLAVVFLTGLFAAVQESKSAKMMAGFSSLTAEMAEVVRNGEQMKVPAESLVKGDLVIIEAGQKIPADLRLIEVNVMKVDNSSLTGEPEPLVRKVECTHDNPMETKNLCFFGTGVTEGRGVGVVISTGDDTVIGGIAAATNNAVKPPSTLKLEIHYFVVRMAFLAVGMGLLLMLLKIFMPSDDGKTYVQRIPAALVIGISVLAANVPEGLLPQLTVQLTLTAQKMKASNVLVKNLEIVETLGSTSVIASDKTGTLTQNKMTVSHLIYDTAIFNSGPECVSGDTYPRFEAESDGFTHLRTCGSLSTRATFIDKIPGQPVNLGTIKIKGDASETALLKFVHPIHDIDLVRQEHNQVAEIPFNSNNKWALSINRTGDSLTIFMKGAPERITARCTTARVKGENVPIDPLRKKIAQLNTDLARRGERVLAFAELALDPSDFPPTFHFDMDAVNFPLEGLTFLGMISLVDPPRPEVQGSIAVCQTAGIQVIMVTGDHPETARAIARKIGIMPGMTRDEVAEQRGISPEKVDGSLVEGVVVTGTDLLEFSEADWDFTLGKSQIVFARTMPQQKQEIVRRLQAKNHVVAVTGDGTNDCPALRQAQCGVAMGITGSDIAQEAAQVVLLDDNFSSLVVGIREGRMIFDNMKKCIFYTLTHLTPEIVPFLLTVLAALPAPLSPLELLMIDLATDLIPAICMAWEGGEEAVMTRPPRRVGVDRLVGPPLFFCAYLLYGVWETCIALACWYIALSHYGFTTYAQFKDLNVCQGESGDFGGDACARLTSSLVGTSHEVQVKPEYIKSTVLFLGTSCYLYALVMSQVGNVLCAKSRYSKAWQSGFNWHLAVGVLFSLAIINLLVYCPGVTDVFETKPIKGTLYLHTFIVWGGGIIVMNILNEMRKAGIRNFPSGCFAAFCDY